MCICMTQGGTSTLGVQTGRGRFRINENGGRHGVWETEIFQAESWHKSLVGDWGDLFPPETDEVFICW